MIGSIIAVHIAAQMANQTHTAQPEPQHVAMAHAMRQNDAKPLPLRLTKQKTLPVMGEINPLAPIQNKKVKSNDFKWQNCSGREKHGKTKTIFNEKFVF